MYGNTLEHEKLPYIAGFCYFFVSTLNLFDFKTSNFLWFAVRDRGPIWIPLNFPIPNKVSD